MDQRRVGLAAVATLFLLVLAVIRGRFAAAQAAAPPTSRRQHRTLAVAVVVALCAVGVIGTLTAYGRNMVAEYQDRLRYHGVAVTGTVERAPGGGFTYAYVSGGQRREALIHSWPEGERLAAGATIDVMVLPEDPSFSQPLVVLRQPSRPRVPPGRILSGWLIVLGLCAVTLRVGWSRAAAAEKVGEAGGVDVSGGEQR